MKNAAFSIEELFRFLDAGVSAFHSTAAASAILEAEGYVNCPESAAWELAPGGKYYTTRNGSAVLAWRMPRGELTGWHAAASHSDSPTWRIKQFDTEDKVFAKAEVEGYGGMIMPSWLDRPLTVAGRLLVRTESGIESRLVCPDRALACIPNLCIHFNHDLNNGMKYNPQVDLQPIFGGKGGNLKEVLAAEAGVKAEDILDADLVLATREKAVRMGLNGEYFMSGRIDDLECAYTTLWGFLQGRGEEEGRGDIWVMFDNEEVGSSSRQGAQGTLMADVLARIEESMGVSREQSIRARTNSLVLSADNGHATHPNHPEKSDPANPVVMGGGVLLKYNARQTYTTSGFTGAAFTAICKKAGVPVQVFANRADVPGGSTLGNLLGHQILMPMVDIGLASWPCTPPWRRQAAPTPSTWQRPWQSITIPHLPAEGRGVEAGPVSAVVGRFAPSPSGRLHLGNLACSLLAWLSARSRGGRIVLRIEDLDAERCPRKYADQLEEDLGWLGLFWDEGGSKGGPHEPYYQSECSGIYRAAKSWKPWGLSIPASAPAASSMPPVRPIPRTATSSIPAPAGG